MDCAAAAQSAERSIEARANTIELESADREDDEDDAADEEDESNRS